MPKMKTKSSAKKRFKLTGSGKIKRKHAFKSHILTKKSKKRKKIQEELEEKKREKEKIFRRNWKKKSGKRKKDY